MKVSWRFLILLAIWAVATEGQPSTQGFVSIDCGAMGGTSYQDSTGIWYVSDDSYIETGENYNIAQNYTSLSKQASTLRSFPNQTRNCYTLRNVTKDSKYLLRATFLYGNYDGKQMAQISTPLQFDLYIDVGFWRRVNITNASSEYAYEVITVAVRDFIWVCLVNINVGTPFISTLELRPLKSYLYPYASQNQSNAILFRLNYGSTKDVAIRYKNCRSLVASYHGNYLLVVQHVRSLSLVHHKNLVTLVGYCKDGDDLAVVYEYMPRGSLFDHLRGKDSTLRTLNWRMRLKISLEAAQALDYLHTGCGIVHRDVKSSNILLGQNFEAKLSDLGLAKMFSADTNSSLITLCGTPGYIDPEYQRTLTLNEKSDVYSFGVILLEIVTGEPPILIATENIHIVKLVKEKIDQGSIEDVIDSRLNGEYDMNSMWKVVELAMICTREKSTQRPTMAEVVIQLKDSLQMEEHRQKENLQPSDESDMNTSSISISLSIGQSFALALR